MLEILFIISFVHLATAFLLRLTETESYRMEKRLQTLIKTTTDKQTKLTKEKSLFRRLYDLLLGSISRFVTEQQRKGRLGSLDLKIKQSGENVTTNEIWTRSFILALVGLFLGVLTKKTFLIIGLPLLGAYFPIMRLDSKIKDRQEEFKVNFPNFLDLVAITFPSTNNITETFRIVCREYDNVVSDEFKTVVSQIDSGRNSRDVYQGLVERVGLREVSNLVNQIHQAESMGTGLQEVINTQARVIRAERKNMIIEKGNKAQMLIYLPAFLFLFIFMATILFPFIAPIASEFLF